jgi:assimilatory nitrate reductase catalytic subunit
VNAPSHHPPAVRTTCAYCGVGCGILAKPDGRGGAVIGGDPEHPANFGRLCSKGSALGETLGLASRLLHPMRRDSSGVLTQISWDAALGHVADGFLHTIDRYGPESVAFYLSGQLLTEDYYVANKLMKGFLGSANVDTNSRLCMASSVAGHRRAFGADTVPGTYADLDLADLLVLVGSNAAWCHPVLYQRMIANKRARGAKIVVIDPRRTHTAEDADLFLPIAPGMDTALLAGLLVHLADTLALDYGYIDANTSGIVEALARAREIAPDISATAAACELAEADVTRFFDLFRSTPKVVTAFSQGVNQSAQGTDKVNAIINCHLATGRIGRPGMGPFSLTGQPNAMGGREVGGLANQLAAHMGFTPGEIDRVARFWRAPAMARREGLKAVQMFDAIARGQIKALWVMATNPAVSLPRARVVREALAKLDLFAVSDNVSANDTINAGAQILLPAAAWGEKDGTVTNSERRISRQRPFLPTPGETKPDWWIVAQVARRMGFVDSFEFRSAADVFREHAALSAFENEGTRDFDIGGLARLSDAEFNVLDPVQWPVRAGKAHGESRFFAQGGFFTPDKKAHLIAPKPPAPHTALSPQFPFRLNTGRLRDQWHTMTRSGLSPRLANHAPEPCVEVHPDDAAAARLTHGGFARVHTLHGACVLKVAVNDGQQRGSLFVPIHWSDTTASSARVGELVTPANDPLSGQPEAKATPAAVEPAEFRFRGFALTRGNLALPPSAWWSRVTLTKGSGLLLATDEPSSEWRRRGAAMFGVAEIAEYCDEPRGIYRLAAFL